MRAVMGHHRVPQRQGDEHDREQPRVARPRREIDAAQCDADEETRGRQVIAVLEVELEREHRRFHQMRGEKEHRSEQHQRGARVSETPGGRRQRAPGDHAQQRGGRREQPRGLGKVVVIQAHGAAAGEQQQVRQIVEQHARLAQHPLVCREVTPGIAAEHPPGMVRGQHARRDRGQGHGQRGRGQRQATRTRRSLEAEEEGLHREDQQGQQRAVLLAERGERPEEKQCERDERGSAGEVRGEGLASDDVAEQPAQREQRGELRHALHDVEHRADHERRQQPCGAHPKCDPPAMPRDAGGGGRQQAPAQPEDQRAAQQVDHEVGVFHEPHVRSAGDPVGDEARHGYGTPRGLAGDAPEHDLAPPDLAALHGAQRLEVRVVVEDQVAGEPARVARRGQAEHQVQADGRCRLPQGVA